MNFRYLFSVPFCKRNKSINGIISYISEESTYKEKIFDDIKHLDELENEYWETIEFMLVLGYSKWEHFAKVINKAKISC